jgi:Tripartite tricarboxylate transporter family receptor
MTDLLGGQVQVLFGSTSLTIEQIRAGKLRPLAVTTATRWEGLPDIPTVGDFVPGYEASAVLGLGAPKKTPDEIIDKLNKEINAGLADPEAEGAVCRPGRHGACGLACRLRQVHRRRNGEVGQGDPGGQHQGRIGATTVALTFHKCRSANSGRSPARDDRNVRFAVAIG